MHSFQDILRLYDYPLAPARIAQAPATPRDSAKLLVYDRKKESVQWSSVRHLPEFLPRGCVLVLNETKVIPARMHLRRSTGGRVSILILGIVNGRIRALANRRIRTGETLSLLTKKGAPAGRPYTFTVARRLGKEWLLRPSFALAGLPAILNRAGSMPLPPYIKHTPLTERELRSRYQTVFARLRPPIAAEVRRFGGQAKNSGSIAAPTASLHFTKPLLKKLERCGVTIARVTLHVHLGTFASLTEEQWKSGELHSEFYSIDSRNARLITRAKREGRPIIAAGTTVARCLESAADFTGDIIHPRGVTRLFIREGYRFKVVNGLLTNFHVPKSSLLMLVGALIGRPRLLELYAKAIKKRFRFFSFGDAMLVV
ncbi:MAG: tRNA preQ1(34) S-adenosylmethionine ribosyltransferase-isomerase QueA [Candidatus Peribacteraceae bacterium]|nr:tRNA preQ1(34) S-adenosylmethionine ribosyltransferase-isomerase QueA [Candidatus Peribacteraceae bacterium]